MTVGHGGSARKPCRGVYFRGLFVLNARYRDQVNRFAGPAVSRQPPHRPDERHPMTNAGSDFYGSIPVFRGFTKLMEPKLYSPLPDDWSVGVADIVESTKAIAAQRYKAVNMAGAAVIASVTNAREGREFPFVFGGDGASFAVV